MTNKQLWDGTQPYLSRTTGHEGNPIRLHARHKITKKPNSHHPVGQKSALVA